MSSRRPPPHARHAAATDPDEVEAATPSKTQLKKAMLDLQRLGEDLLELTPARLAALALPERLADALEALRRIRDHEGRRRQLQYVGKLMRGVEAQPLREALAEQRLPGARETLALHRAEHWRDRLIEDDAALAEFVDAHPDLDVQHLRALLRQARADRRDAAEDERRGQAPRKSRAYRDVYQLVRHRLDAAAALDPANRQPQLMADDDPAA
jgi:ribosome-associated protein